MEAKNMQSITKENIKDMIDGVDKQFEEQLKQQEISLQMLLTFCKPECQQMLMEEIEKLSENREKIAGSAKKELKAFLKLVGENLKPEEGEKEDEKAPSVQ